MDIPFIDLKAQYLRLQSEISSGIDKVFEHGAGGFRAGAAVS